MLQKQSSHTLEKYIPYLNIKKKKTERKKKRHPQWNTENIRRYTAPQNAISIEMGGCSNRSFS